MKYFQLKNSLDIKAIGDYPQIQNFKHGYNPNKQESCSQISRYYFGKKPDIEIDFDGLELAEKAQLTDYVSTSYLSRLTGLLVSTNLNNFLSGLHMVKHVSFAARIYHKQASPPEEYKWIHFIESYPEIINYSKSDFFLDHTEARFKKLSLASFSEYQNAQDKTPFKINSKRLVLKKEIASKFDILRIGVVRNEPYVTEPVKDEVIKRGFTGLVFEPANHLIID